MKNSFLQEGYNQSEYENTILAYLKTQSKGGGVTLADVVVNTALKTEWVEYTLRQMLGKFSAYLDINSKHELVYLFDLTPKPLSVGKYLWQGIQRVLWTLWLVFMMLFKVLIVGMLLTYGIFYALVVVFILEAITRSGEIFWEVCKGFWFGAGEIWNMLLHKDKLKQSDKHLLTDVFSYVFGATIHKKDPLAIEKLILQQIRAQAGKLVPVDIVRLTGWDLIQAQTQAAYLLANYQGEVVVTEAGKIEYHFPDLIKENEQPNLPAPIWEQPFDMPKMNNLDKDSHLTITGINIFNMVMSMIVLPITIMFTFPSLNGNIPDWVIVWLMLIPFTFSFIFLLIPLCRYPFIQIQQAKAKKAYQRLLVLGEIFKRLPAPIAVASEAKVIAESTQIHQEVIFDILQKLQIDMQADAVATPEGVVYEFNLIS